MTREGGETSYVCDKNTFRSDLVHFSLAAVVSCVLDVVKYARSVRIAVFASVRRGFTIYRSSIRIFRSRSRADCVFCRKNPAAKLLIVDLFIICFNYIHTQELTQIYNDLLVTYVIL